MKDLRVGLKLYTSSLSKALYASLITLLLLLLIPYHGKESVGLDAAALVDVIGMPIIAFFAALDVVRDPMATTFEVGILSSIRRLFISRIITYSVLISIPLALVPPVLGVLNNDLYLSILSKFLTYVAIASIAFLIDDYRMVIFYLVTFVFIIPYAPLAIMNRALMSGTKLGLGTGLLCYYFDPVVSYVNRKLFAISIPMLSLASALTSITIIALSYVAFSRKEFVV